MILTFYTSVSKGLKLSQKVLRAEVTEKKLVAELFATLHPEQC